MLFRSHRVSRVLVVRRVNRVSLSLGVSHGQKCVPGGLPNGARRREPDVMDALNVSRGRMNEPGGHRGFRVVRGRLPETCHGVLVELGSSRVACLHLLLGGHRVSRVSHEKVVHRGRRNDAVRGLPSVMTERRPLKREACVVRGRQPLKLFYQKAR